MGKYEGPYSASGRGGSKAHTRWLFAVSRLGLPKANIGHPDCAIQVALQRFVSAVWISRRVNIENIPAHFVAGHTSGMSVQEPNVVIKMGAVIFGNGIDGRRRPPKSTGIC